MAPSHSVDWFWLILMGPFTGNISEISIKIHMSVEKCIWEYCLRTVNHYFSAFTHSGRATHKCIGNLIIGSDYGLSPGRRQAIIWTNDEILLTGPLETNFSDILIEIHAFSFKKMLWKRSSAEWRPFCLGLHVLMRWNFVSECRFPREAVPVQASMCWARHM